MNKQEQLAHLYERIGFVLRIGIISSIVVMVVGFVLFLTNGLSSLGSSIILLATLILILTPISRVMTATLLFIQEGDRRYFFVTISVLILIFVSFLVGLLLLRAS